MNNKSKTENNLISTVYIYIYLCININKKVNTFKLNIYVNWLCVYSCKIRISYISKNKYILSRFTLKYVVSL